MILTVCSGYLRHITLSGTDVRTILYIIAVYSSYGFIYLLPALLLTKACHRILSRWQDNGGGWVFWVVNCLALTSVSGTILLLLGDRMVYDLYAFHVNGFVWNLVTTPGGISSMGGSSNAFLVIAALVVGMLALQAVVLWLTSAVCRRFLAGEPLRPQKMYLYLLVVFVVFTVGERFTYGISKLQAYGPVLTASNAFPFYQPATFYHLAKKMGYQVEREKAIKVAGYGDLQYPRNPLVVREQGMRPNIVWLVAESWRHDMLDPEIMPATWKFARQAHRFTSNYSGGNGTRMGIFSMFYGLYGPYWFPFLNARQGPVFMDVLQQLNYQISMYTSAKFTYPEFDRTVLVKLPDEVLHECHEGAGWQRDRQNVGDLLAFIRDRDRQQPFFTFMFFESPHARYYFPPESAIRQDYLQELNYATMSLEKDIQRIKNRYINSCSHLDSQFQRIFDVLDKEQLLDTTIVVLVGDHGEEFMEKGRWGHNSEFHEEQVLTPLVVWVPGTGGSVSARMTSHLDIVPTLLPLLGVENPASDYSLGYNLLGSEQRRYTVVGDWSRVAYVDEDYKVVIPFKKAGVVQSRVTTRKDQLEEDQRGFLAAHQNIILTLMKDLSIFKRSAGK